MKELKYQQISQIIRAQIAEGFWTPGDKIYSERQLSEIHDVSRLTVKRALSELVSEGMLEYKTGRQGTFVSSAREVPEARPSGGEQFVGVAVDNHTPAFASHILQGIHEGLWQKGFHTLYCNTYQESGFIVEQIASLIRTGINGFILTPVLGPGAEQVNQRILALLDEKNIPFVLVDRFLESRTDNQVVLNNREIFRELAETLRREGCRRLLLINGYDATSSKARVQGVGDVYSRTGEYSCYEISLDEKDLNQGTGVPREVLDDLRRQGPFSAVVGVNQLLLDAGIQMMKTLGQRPLTATIVTSPRERYSDFSVVQPISRMGKEAALLLSKRIADPSLPVTQLTLKAVIQDNREA